MYMYYTISTITKIQTTLYKPRFAISNIAFAFIITLGAIPLLHIFENLIKFPY